MLSGRRHFLPNHKNENCYTTKRESFTTETDNHEFNNYYSFTTDAN